MFKKFYNWLSHFLRICILLVLKNTHICTILSDPKQVLTAQNFEKRVSKGFLNYILHLYTRGPLSFSKKNIIIAVPLVGRPASGPTPMWGFKSSNDPLTLMTLSPTASLKGFSPGSNIRYCPLYGAAHCTALPTVRRCPLYGAAHCTALPTVRHCPLYGAAHCTTLSTVRRCPLYGGARAASLGRRVSHKHT
jgi:hypothetical protein